LPRLAVGDMTERRGMPTYRRTPLIVAIFEFFADAMT